MIRRSGERLPAGDRSPSPRSRAGSPGDRLETSHPLARKDISEVMARILVTGGLGTVGKVLVWTLNKRGHVVKVSGIEHHHEPDYVRCDVGSYMQLSRIFEHEGFDFVRSEEHTSELQSPMYLV